MPGCGMMLWIYYLKCIHTIMIGMHYSYWTQKISTDAMLAHFHFGLHLPGTCV